MSKVKMVMEVINDQVAELNDKEVARELNIGPGAAWDSWDELLACADFEFLRSKLVIKRLDELVG